MSNLSDYAAEALLNHLLRNTAYTPVATVYLAAFTAVTGLDTNAPTAEVSTSGTAYARQACAFDAAASKAVQNTDVETFAKATASWGTVTHIAIVDHAANTNDGTDVNVLAWAALSTSRTIDTGSRFKVKAGELTLTLSAMFSQYCAHALLNLMFRNTAFTSPTNVYSGLFTAVTGLDTNAPTAEVSGNAYAREQLAFDAPTGEPPLCDNTGDETFPEATGSWGTITHQAVMDALSSGNVLLYGALTASAAITTGDEFQWDAGDLSFSLT